MRRKTELSEIGRRVREARLESRLTQARLAAMAGVSRATLNGLEKGAVRELGFLKLDAIFRILGYRLAPTPAPATIPACGILRRLARRYVWWQSPDKSKRDPHRVLAQVMDMGTLEDIQLLAGTVGKEELADVLKHARAGWFHPKSWAFWHMTLGLAGPGEIPPMPVRKRDGLPDPA